jgi:erythromycin esterase-like protein
MSIRRSCVALFLTAILVGAGACHSSKPPAAVLPPPPLNDAQSAALRWVESHAIPVTILDSLRPAADRTPFLTFVGNARVLGVSELTEGTHQFAGIMQQILSALTTRGFRGIAIQAPMAETMELDRYVRTGIGSPRQSLRVLGPHWRTQEVLDLVEWIHAYNRSHGAAEQIGVYGFELPTAAHAVQVVTSLPDSIAGSGVTAFLRREIGCVTTGESAAWGRDGPASDSSFWNRCRGSTTAIVDTLVALRGRLGTSRPGAQGTVAFAELMARVAQHDADVGLKRLPRHQTVAEHILWLADQLGRESNLLVWGRDVESGRLTGEGNVVQSAVPLAGTLGDRYRNLAFTAGSGTVRAQPINVGQREPGGETNMDLRPPRPDSYEYVLNRATGTTLFLDFRALAGDTAASWLEGPHPARLVSGIYSESPLGTFETPLQFPAYYDGLLFAKHVTPATPLKR